MAKNTSNYLGDMRRNEHREALAKLPDRELCELVRAHFESHPALPGEKVLKDAAYQALALAEDSQGNIPEGFTPAAETPFDNSLLDPELRESMIDGYARTRIRETPLKEGNMYLDYRHYDPSDLKRDRITVSADSAGNSVNVDKVDVELQRTDAGEVYVLAPTTDGGHRTIGHLPDSFLKNSPMNVESCAAEMEISDYSNGQMKNISARVVVDTDLMSGDVIDLDEDMLQGMEQEDGLNK